MVHDFDSYGGSYAYACVFESGLGQWNLKKVIITSSKFFSQFCKHVELVRYRGGWRKCGNEEVAITILLFRANSSSPHL